MLELVEPFAGLVRVRRPVHAPQPGAHLLAVVVGHEPVRRADQMHHAGLHHRVRPRGLDGLGQALQPVAAHDQHVHDAPVGHLRAHVRPERGSLRILYPDAQHVLDTLHVDADRDVCGLRHDPAAVPDLDAYRVQVHDRVELVQRTLLPFEHRVRHRVGDRRDRLVRQFRADRLGEVVPDVAHGHASRIQAYDHVVQAAEPPGALRHQPGRERPLPVARHLDRDGADLGGQGLGIRAVPRILRAIGLLARPVSGPIAQMRGHLRLQAALQRRAHQFGNQTAVARQFYIAPVDAFEQGIQRPRRGQTVDQFARRAGTRHGTIAAALDHIVVLQGHHDSILPE